MLLNKMQVSFTTVELRDKLKNCTLILIGKFWIQKNSPNTFAKGRIGIKKRESEIWDFSELKLHNRDKLVLKVNRLKVSDTEPDFSLYVEKAFQNE